MLVGTAKSMHREQRGGGDTGRVVFSGIPLSRDAVLRSISVNGFILLLFPACMISSAIARRIHLLLMRSQRFYFWGVFICSGIC